MFSLLILGVGSSGSESPLPVPKKLDLTRENLNALLGQGSLKPKTTSTFSRGSAQTSGGRGPGRREEEGGGIKEDEQGQEKSPEVRWWALDSLVIIIHPVVIIIIPCDVAFVLVILSSLVLFPLGLSWELKLFYLYLPLALKIIIFYSQSELSKGIAKHYGLKRFHSFGRNKQKKYELSYFLWALE